MVDLVDIHGGELSLDGCSPRPEALFLEDTDHIPVERVAISSLVVEGSPRSCGMDAGHAAALAESEDRLPPILVHRSTMRVIDGVHRLRAAKLRGQDQIDARFVDGTEEACFILAVTANARHGLPLTPADKKAAAVRIIGLYPQWSDRAIAALTTLHHQTVAAIRKRSTGQIIQSNNRIGRDGRSRPNDIAQRRELASELIASNPGASLREIARKAEISPATVARVRAQLNGGGVAAPTSPGAGPPVPRKAPQGHEPAGATTELNQVTAWQALRGDPAVRSTQAGRALLQVLGASLAIRERGQEILETIPAYSLGNVAAVARQCARVLDDFVRRAEMTQPRPGVSAP
jgi:ParB-like chromosome segregation protein Spo0J